MIVSIIGNANLEKMAFVSQKPKNEILKLYREIGKKLAELNVEIMMVPEGPIRELMKSYKQNNGNKIIGIIPKQDKIWGYHWLETGKVDEEYEEYDCGDWIKLPFEIVNKADIVLCLSIGTGVLAEITFLKYLHKYKKASKKLIVFTNFLREGKLPIEIEYDIKDLVVYVNSVEEMAAELQKEMQFI